MPSIVYRIIEVLSVLVTELPLGTNLAVFHLLWAVLSGRLLASRGAIIPALAASGLATAAIRRAWAALAYGAWDVAQLLARLQALVGHEGRWHRQRVGAWRPVAVDGVGFFRPRLKDCPTKHFASQVGKALPAIPFGILTAVGAVGPQTVPVLRGIVRAPDNPTLLTAAQADLAADEFLVADRGFFVAQMQAAGVARYVLRVAKNFTARRACLPAYAGRGRRPKRGALVRPCARTYRGRELAATPPDRTETWQQDRRVIQAQVWDALVSSTATPDAPTFTCYRITDPAYAQPLLVIASLNLTAAEAQAAYRARWPVEQVPLVAKQLLGAHRQFVFGDASRQRLPELALLAGSLLMYLAATQPAQPTGFWDRTPQPTAGRLRRQLAQHQYSEDWPLLADLRKKNSVTDHLPKGITGHRRSPADVRASATPT
ncbi:MAG: hypothetical protein IT317_10605 [Anaerolineales bacterium]|nr:hypothetical protein [Anaerolineales bacterium]